MATQKERPFRAKTLPEFVPEFTQRIRYRIYEAH